MSDPARRDRMTAEQFIAWAMQRPETEHYELVAGEVVAMAPERLAHVEGKQRAFLRLMEAVARQNLPCQVLIDGMAVKVDDYTVYEPDVLLRCGPKLPGNTLKITDPLIVVEVVSPSSRAVDEGLKFSDYFRIPTVRHYLLVRPETRTIIHHARADDGSIASRIHGENPLRLDPPGIEIADLFG